MSREELDKLYDARNKLCCFCDNDELCEKCQVTLLIDQADIEYYGEIDEEAITE